MNQDEQLLRQITQRNWIILALLVTASTFWRSTDIILGVLSGGLVAIVAYHWRYKALKKMLATPNVFSAKGFQFGYIVRLVFIASAIFLLIAKFKVHPLALVVGLSIVVLNILWTTVKQAY